MKKIYLTAYLSLVVMLSCIAQPNLSNVGVYDNFSTAMELTTDVVTGRGIYWWNGLGQALTRNSVNSRLDVVMTQGAYQYVPFGVAFGDDNGVAAGGVPYTIDLSANGLFSFDITNVGTQGLSIRVACQDVNNKLVDCSPGAVVFGDIWKYQTQIEVPIGQTITFEAGTANGAGGNIINNCDFANGVWGDYGTNPHIIRTDCDLTKIKSINITALNAAKNIPGDGHNKALTDGRFSITNFKVGDIATSLLKKQTVTKTFSLYPNPAKNTVTVKNNSFENATIQLVDVYGKNISVLTASSSANESVLDVSALTQGIYFVQVGEQLQKLVIE